MGGSANIGPAFAGLLRAIVSNVMAILQGRFELFSVELQEERRRLLWGLVWAGAAVVCATMALVLINVTLVYLFWEEARLAVLIGLSVFYLAAVAGIGLGFRRSLKRKRIPFSDTIHELRKDYECLRKRN